MFFAVFTRYQNFVSRRWRQHLPLLSITCQQQKVEATKNLSLTFGHMQRNCTLTYQGFKMSEFSCCSQRLLRSPRKPTRKISKIPFKVLDAPELQDDFYLNLVDWSPLNVLSVGLGTCVCLWSACTSQVLQYVQYVGVSVQVLFGIGIFELREHCFKLFDV